MWEGTIAQNGCVQFQIYTGKQGGAERVIEWFKIRQNNLKRKSYVWIWIFFSSSLAQFESPRGERIFCRCTVRRSRKGMPQAVKSIRNSACGLIMHKGNRITVEWKDLTISVSYFAWMVG